MPGILPMKIIKVGTSAQSRIAQACDRCRSKKIRCAGERPCCAQCANVGFECKTSDKLSRRAFPRGYTESLEERVRGLEAEVREFKDLLDEKDEKIDMLSRIHSTSLHSIQLPSPRRPSTVSVESGGGKAEVPDTDEIFRVQQSPYLLDELGSDSYFSGTSSARTFIDAFKHRVQETGRSTADIDTSLLLDGGLRKPTDSPATPPKSPIVWKVPPRLVSDQLINIFFQEWAPLFPILHRPAFLTLYGKYVADPDSVTDKVEIAQLNLVFGIASLSSGTKSSSDLESFETQWKSAMDAVLTDNSMPTLQALVLAQIYCIQQCDLTRLMTYKGLSTSLSARLGLHQSQKRFALGTLTCETRKKVFWTLYTVDSFTAVTLGLPKHLKDEDVQCEFPVDADDEYITESGFQPTLPGESTKLSSALALFRVSRILSKVLEEVYPAKASYDLSFKRLSELSDELDAWSSSLAPHLRLQFVQDKPSTGTINSRSPLLSFTYHYIRALLQRPVLCASLGAKQEPYLMTMASACKHMIQIMQLLDERGLSFSFCLNRDEVLVLSGFGLLFQGLGLNSNSKVLKDNIKMTSAIIDVLTKSSAPCATEFKRVAHSFLPMEQENPISPSRQTSDVVTQDGPSSTRKQLKAIASRFAVSNAFKARAETVDELRRAPVHTISLHPHSPQTRSVPSLQPARAAITRSEPARSPANTLGRPLSAPSDRQQVAMPPPKKAQMQTPPQKTLNLDYLSFGSEPQTPQPSGNPSKTVPIKPEPGPTDWDKLLGGFGNGEPNIYDAFCDGPLADALLDAPAPELHHTSSTSAIDHTADVWNADLWSLCQSNTTASVESGTGNAASIFSFSTDEGSSGEDFSADWASASSSNGSERFPGIVMPFAEEDGLEFVNSWDANLNL